MNNKTLAALCAVMTATAYCCFAAQAWSTTSNHYDVTISSGPTQNMMFSNGVYSATADNAVLNVGDLENALVAGNTEVTTGDGSGGDEEGNLHVAVALTWSSVNKLELDAYQTILVGRLISDSGSGAITLRFNHGSKSGELGFGPKGRIAIRDLSIKLTIQGKIYTLAGDIQSLASEIAVTPTGLFALANNYDASKDGSYSSAPIPEFEGVFNGLGNTISNLQIVDTNQYDNVGFFALLNGAAVSDIKLSNEAVSAPNGSDTGGLVGDAERSLILDVRVSGSVAGPESAGGPTGGIAGVVDYGVVSEVSSSAAVKSAGQSIGGLVGYNDGVIEKSFSTGKTKAYGSQEVLVGDLVGQTAGTVEDSYSIGEVVGGYPGILGGLAGYLDGHSPVKTSYSTGYLQATGGTIGGLIGLDNNSPGWIIDCYWDLDTSGVTNPSQGAGSPANDPGITGMTSQQLQSGLPVGFDPKIWAESSSINNGFPYLISNPPPQ